VRDLDLELALAGCGRELSFPPTPDLVSAVARRLPLAVRRHRSRRRVLVLAFAILLATAGIAAGVTAGLRGLGVVFVDRLPPVPPGKGLSLGLQVKAAEARKLARFRLVMPGPPLGKPDALFVGDIGGGERSVALVWGHHPGLPPLRHGVSVIVTESAGSVNEGFLKKVLVQGTTLQNVKVGASDGLWIDGPMHLLTYLSGTGQFATQQLRLVGNVLAWNRGNLLLRIEGARTLAEAQRLAASFGSGTG
jgi:hypothetical protein